MGEEFLDKLLKKNDNISSSGQSEAHAASEGGQSSSSIGDYPDFNPLKQFGKGVGAQRDL